MEEEAVISGTSYANLVKIHLVILQIFATTPTSSILFRPLIISPPLSRLRLGTSPPRSRPFQPASQPIPALLLTPNYHNHHPTTHKNPLFPPLTSPTHSPKPTLPTTHLSHPLTKTFSSHHSPLPPTHQNLLFPPLTSPTHSPKPTLPTTHLSQPLTKTYSSHHSPFPTTHKQKPSLRTTHLSHPLTNKNPLYPPLTFPTHSPNKQHSPFPTTHRNLLFLPTHLSKLEDPVQN
ncbi:hypothetical protein Pcinc_042541 [Petrolisthes cinctipes]|uniref:Uncharacterized protein n=1 Tax=Petrolisthes cinctipes TaxID=88211 RepID=A0AAE1BHQ7_PETCI|nr:hypothetical protein Pcinc_042541 [Petrolisthes cinctipes]